MTKTQQIRCHLAIHATSLAAASIGAGLAQLPCADAVVIVPLEVSMIIALGGVFGLRLTQSKAEATLAGTTGTLCGRGLSQLLVGCLPGIGNALDALTAALVVQLVGWAVAADFDSQANSRTKDKERNGEKSDSHKKA